MLDSALSITVVTGSIAIVRILMSTDCTGFTANVTRLITIVAIIASVAIMLYAANNGINKPEEQSDDDVFVPSYETESVTVEEDSSLELTTISTTKPQETTTEKPTETTTKKPETTKER